MDVHQATISAAVLDCSGRVVMECIVETKAATVLDFIVGIRGSLCVTFEEGTCAGWLYDLLWPKVNKIVVCDPRKNALLQAGNKSDKIDARKLAELLRVGQLSAVYHNCEAGIRRLRELARSYLALTKDLTRVMNRIKAAYRSWGIGCSGTQVFTPKYRAAWLEKLPEAGVRSRVQRLYAQYDCLTPLRQEARQDLLLEARKHSATQLLRQIPCIGPIRSALLALLQTPHRFRTKRQLWAYSGLALESEISGEYCMVGGRIVRSKKQLNVRGLNRNHNHDLKYLFKSAALAASISAGPFRDFYTALLIKGMKPALARLTLARKIAAIVLVVWKRGGRFDAQRLKPQAA